jgi:hypothetical protein
MEFGILIQPFDDLSQKSSPPTIDEYRIAIAKVLAGDIKWRKSVKEFATFADDVEFHEEYGRIAQVPENLRGKLSRLVNDFDIVNYSDDAHLKLKKEVKGAKHNFKFLERVPFEWEPIIFEANTPFTSYLRIMEAMSLINDRLHYFDRYLKDDFFFLFLKRVNKNISLSLITTRGNKNYGINNVSHISNLACKEFKDYKLIEVQPNVLHDRNLRIDDRIFSLGSGTDRAGMALTNFGPSDNSDDAHKEFDDIIRNGTIIHSS